MELISFSLLNYVVNKCTFLPEQRYFLALELSIVPRSCSKFTAVLKTFLMSSDISFHFLGLGEFIVISVYITQNKRYQINLIQNCHKSLSPLDNIGWNVGCGYIYLDLSY